MGFMDRIVTTEVEFCGFLKRESELLLGVVNSCSRVACLGFRVYGLGFSPCHVLRVVPHGSYCLNASMCY